MSLATDTVPCAVCGEAGRKPRTKMIHHFDPSEVLGYYYCSVACENKGGRHHHRAEDPYPDRSGETYR